MEIYRFEGAALFWSELFLLRIDLLARSLEVDLKNSFGFCLTWLIKNLNSFSLGAKLLLLEPLL